MRGLRALVLGGLLFAACGLEAATPYFNGVFPSQAPGSATGWTQQNAFPQLTFTDPLWLAPIPGGNELMMVCKGGQVWRFPNDPAVSPGQVSPVLDLSSAVQESDDQGFYRIVFHPQFGVAGSPHANEVFACYSHRPVHADAGPDRSLWRVSRFLWSPATGSIDPASETVLIQQYDPHRWHNGGAMAFDNDGFLLITCGDGGSAEDSLGLAQKIDGGFFGGVLRIDVDQDPARSHPIPRQPSDPAGKPATFPASFTQGYGIPNDNPWVGRGALEEFHAIGLRSPHAAHYDAPTGDLWVGDVGQHRREELNRVTAGGNHQWPFMEGTVPAAKSRPASLVGVETPPFHSYEQAVGTCIIGGMRYRGAKWAAELGGRVVFGDNARGTISVADVPAAGGAPAVREITAGIGPGIYAGLSNICTDAAGEIYFLKLNGRGQPGGIVLKLVPAATAVEPPALLSATGLFQDTATLQPATALLPYEVASPLWSDGAEKKRWIVVPTFGSRDLPTEKIAFKDDGNWSFPAGTVFVKHFAIPLDERDPAVVRRLETRVMVCTPDGGKYGITYKWNAAGTDAELLTAGAEENFTVTKTGGATESRTWSFPSRADCMTCHTPAAGQALGLRTHQWNRPIVHPQTGSKVNQLAYFNTMQFFQPALTGTMIPNALAAAPLDDTAVPVEHRVRSYLDSNCSHCHQPDGNSPFFDARLETPLRGQNLINGLITGRFEPGAGGRYVKPGNPLLSAVHLRLASAEPGVAMPPLGKHVVDQRAADLLEDYITGLTTEEFAGPATLTARYLRLSSLAGSLAAVAELTVLDGRGQPIPRHEISIAAVSSESSVGGANGAIDDNPATRWTSASGPAPHFITLDLGSVREVGGFIYLPRQEFSGGRITSYQVDLSSNLTDWTLATSGTWLATATAAFRYDGLITPRPVRCQISAPEVVRGAFPVTIVFDSHVQDFQIGDIAVTGGSVSGLQGKGYYYSAIVTPDVLAATTPVNVSVAANAVNSPGLGSRAAALSVMALDSVPPTGHFVEQVPEGEGRYRMELNFSEPVTGVGVEDIECENGKVLSLTGSGKNYIVTVAASRFAGMSFRLVPGGILDGGGNPLAGDVWGSTPEEPWYSFFLQGYENIENQGFWSDSDDLGDGNFQHYVHLPDGIRGGVTTLDPAIKIVYRFEVPRAGLYVVRGLTRAEDADGDSFYVGVDGQATPAVWNVNRGKNEVGSGRWHSGDAGAKGKKSYRYPLQPGEHTVEIYAREDGAKLGHIALVPIQPFPMWGDVPVVATGSPIVVPLTFTGPMKGLVAKDFLVTGGRVSAVTGSGANYQVSILPGGPEVTILLPAKKVSGPNTASHVWRFVYQPAALPGMAAFIPSAAEQKADDDRDGVAGLLEYAFGLDPQAPDGTSSSSDSPFGLPSVSVDASHPPVRLVLRYVRRKGIAGLTYTPQFSDTLDGWTDSAARPVVEILDADWERVTVTDTEGTGSSVRYGRVKVEFIAP